MPPFIEAHEFLAALRASLERGVMIVSRNPVRYNDKSKFDAMNFIAALRDQMLRRDHTEHINQMIKDLLESEKIT